MPYIPLLTDVTKFFQHNYTWTFWLKTCKNPKFDAAIKTFMNFAKYIYEILFLREA